ncbi:chitin synthase D [Aspergillus lentulus]|nr:chitin synthase D [Aspergillus lentulus]
MAESSSSVSPNPWSITDIIYLTIVSPLVLAAFLEWFLWIAAFLYCLAKVYQKADHWSIRFLAVTMIVLFTLLRGIFLPVMIVTLPLPAHLRRRFPAQMVLILQWTKRIKQVLDDRTAPKTVVVMPVYKEAPETLIRAIDSVVDCDYPANCIHVFLSYDGCLIDESYLRVIDHLGIPITLESYPQSIDVTYKGARITVSRFKHGGKRHCQKQTFRLIDMVYADYLERHDNLFVLFIDSDCILDRVCLQNFMYDMELKPGSKHDMLAMTGVITSTTDRGSLLTLLQDMEYVHGQLFERSVESSCGAVTCLPGALTMLRFSAFRKMAKYYFADKAEQCEDFFDYGKCHLGEDRWLTHLFMVGARKRYQIQMCAGAFCKTEAVQTFSSLLKQRRRWFLGFITNEVCMLTDVRLWKRYPLLCLVRFMQNTIRTTALLFFIIALSLITTSSSINDLPVGFIAISLGLNYVLMFYLGAKLKRYKAWLFPLMFILNPFFNWLYMVYGILTAGQRTWGGPRADAATADEHTSPEEAIELARAQGDELNVDLATFRSRGDEKSVPIHPSEQIEGRFSAPELPDGYYANLNDSNAALTELMTPLPGVPRIGIHTYPSSDSIITSDSLSSIHLPLKVEELTGDNDNMNSYFETGDTSSLHQMQRTCSNGVMASDSCSSQEDVFEMVNKSQILSPSAHILPHSSQATGSSSGEDIYPLHLPAPHEQETRFAPINASTRGPTERNTPEVQRPRRKLPGIPRPVKAQKYHESMV